MKTEELTERMAGIFGTVMVRVEGIGEQNYADTFSDGTQLQAFEEKPLCDLLNDTLEEVQDAIAYLTFLHIRVERLLKIEGLKR